MSSVNEGVMRMERVGNDPAIAVLYHFAKGHERDAALSSEHHRMIERGESNATAGR